MVSFFSCSVAIPEGPRAMCLKEFNVESNSLVEIRGKSVPCSIFNVSCVVWSVNHVPQLIFNVFYVVVIESFIIFVCKKFLPVFAEKWFLFLWSV